MNQPLTSAPQPLAADHAPGSTLPAVPRPRWRRRVIWLLALCSLLLAAWVFRAPLLRTSADLWIVNQSVTNADAIVVLGGGLQTRPFAAARLYHAGLAPRILLMNVQPEALRLLIFDFVY